VPWTYNVDPAKVLLACPSASQTLQTNGPYNKLVLHEAEKDIQEVPD